MEIELQSVAVVEVEARRSCCEVDPKIGILLRICPDGGGGGTAELQSSLLVEEFLSTRKIRSAIVTL
jgi:hypothetical protein